MQQSLLLAPKHCALCSKPMAAPREHDNAWFHQNCRNLVKVRNCRNCGTRISNAYLAHKVDGETAHFCGSACLHEFVEDRYV